MRRPVVRLRVVVRRPRPVFAAVPPAFRFAPVALPPFFAAVRRFVVVLFVGVFSMLANLLSSVLSHFSGTLVDYAVAALLTLVVRAAGSKGWVTLKRAVALRAVLRFAHQHMSAYAKSTPARWDDLVDVGLAAAEEKVSALVLELTAQEQAKLEDKVKSAAAEVVATVPQPVPALEPSPVSLQVVDTKVEGE